MSCLTLNWPLQAALKKGKIGVNTRFLESFDKKSVFGLVLAFSIRKKGAKKKKKIKKKSEKYEKKIFFGQKFKIYNGLEFFNPPVHSPVRTAKCCFIVFLT